MIKAEVWLSGKGTEPVWVGTLDAIPREGDRVSLPFIRLGKDTLWYDGTVWRVIWKLGRTGLGHVSITLDSWTTS